MTRLNEQQLATFRRDGFLFPLKVAPADEAAGWLQASEECYRDDGGHPSTLRTKHLRYPWMEQLVRHPAILDAVEGVLGPDILCWSTEFFVKDSRSSTFVPWHQDAKSKCLSSPDVVTAWVAFTPSVPDSGCMRVIPGTHDDYRPHHDTVNNGANLIPCGAEVTGNIDLSSAVDVVLQPGEMSLHHVLLLHGSEPNRSDQRRVGLAIRYASPSVYLTDGSCTRALLVRGEDRYGHHDHEMSAAVA